MEIYLSGRKPLICSCCSFLGIFRDLSQFVSCSSHHNFLLLLSLSWLWLSLILLLLVLSVTFVFINIITIIFVRLCWKVVEVVKCQYFVFLLDPFVTLCKDACWFICLSSMANTLVHVGLCMCCVTRLFHIDLGLIPLTFTFIYQSLWPWPLVRVTKSAESKTYLADCHGWFSTDSHESWCVEILQYALPYARYFCYDRK